jgi:hypothetical protein
MVLVVFTGKGFLESGAARVKVSVMPKSKPLVLEAFEALTRSESVRLKELETTIRGGLNTFLEVGDALWEIRESRLYKSEFQSFEEYCATRWKMTRNYANKLIVAAKVVEDLGTDVPKPTSEAQARLLSQLPDPEDRKEAWKDASVTAKEEGSPVTKRHIDAAKRKIVEKDKPPSDAILSNAVERIGRAAGKTFAAEARGKLPAKELVSFSKLPVAQVQGVKALAMKGWAFAEAIAEVQKPDSLTPDNSLRDLMSRAVKSGGAYKGDVSTFIVAAAVEGEQARELQKRLEGWPAE